MMSLMLYIDNSKSSNLIIYNAWIDGKILPCFLAILYVCMCALI